jgi:guanylate kinase
MKINKIAKIEERPRPGLLAVISSPSGTGKTTICHALIKKHDDYQFSISGTSRKQRGKEKNGVDYWFMSREKFLSSKKAGLFLETTEYLGNLYGTPREPVDKAVSKGKVVLLDIDIRGGLTIKKAIPEAVAIFLVPPSLVELKRRLINRRTEDAVAQKNRLAEAWHELKKWNQYDYVVVNDDLNKAVRQVETIIESERLKTWRVESKRFWPKTLIKPLGLTKNSR